MKKSTLLFIFAFAFMFFGCSEKEEKSINESLAEDLLAEFQDNLGSWNACIVYDGKEYTNLDDFLNKDK